MIDMLDRILKLEINDSFSEIKHHALDQNLSCNQWCAPLRQQLLTKDNA